MNYIARKIVSVMLLFTLLIGLTLPYFQASFNPIKIAAANAQSSCTTSASQTSAYIYDDVGGVALDQAAKFLADMNDVKGAYYDANLDRIVFVGQKNVTLPKFDRDDLAVAIKSIIINGSGSPAISIDPDPNDVTKQNVRYIGSIKNTHFGKVLFDADWALKKYFVGVDENGNPTTSSVPGYKSAYDRYIEKGVETNLKTGTRFWITPDIVTLKLDSNNNSFIFDTVKMKVSVEVYSSNTSQKWYDSSLEFANHHTQYFDQFSSEAPAYAQTKQLTKIVSVVKWLKDNNIASDFHWAQQYSPVVVKTPTTVRSLTFQKNVNGINLTVSGGVDYNTANQYSPDSTNASNAIKQSAQSVTTTKEDTHWTFQQNGTTYDAVAVTADAFRSLGSYSTSVTDMSTPTVGGTPLMISRSYSSFSGGQMGMGRGWNIYPASLFDNKPTEVANCSGTILPKSLAFSGGSIYETFTYSCSTGSYVPDDSSYHGSIVRNSDGSFTVTLKDQSKYFFDVSYYLTKITDKNGNTVSYNYDTNGVDGTRRLIAITDPKNHSLTLTYNQNIPGNLNGAVDVITTVSDWTGRKVSYTYDDQANLITVNDPLGGQVKYAYDSNFKLTTVTDRLNTVVTTNTYTDEAKLLTQKDATGTTVTYAYDEANRVVTTQDNIGKVQTTKYDSKARILEAGDPYSKKVTYTFGAERSPLTVTDKNGNKTTNTYDSGGNLLTTTFADGKQVLFEYDIKNNLTKSTDGRYSPARITTFTYDGNNNLKSKNVAGVVSTYNYDSNGLLISETNGLGKTKTYTNDVFGNPTLILDELNNAISLEYDSVGRVTKRTDSEGKITTYTYDQNNNVLTTTDGAGTVAQSYDAEGHVVATTLPNTAKTNFSYNPAGSLTTVTDALAQVTNYNYDNYQNVTTQADALGRNTLHNYDLLNRKTQTTTPNNTIAKWEYDANGNLSKRTDANNKATTYTYDNLNRVSKITYPDLTTVTYTYDNRGNMTKMVDGTGINTYVYDQFDRLISYTNSQNQKVQYAYDTIGNLKKLTYSDGKTVLYDYDDANRLLTTTDFFNQKTQYVYNKNGTLATRTYPNGILTSYSYDNANRLIGINHTKDGAVLAKFTYTRDSVGNITKSTEEGSMVYVPASSGTNPTPTTSITPTNSPTPTSTPIPTATPTVTPTFTPTPTSTPTPTQGATPTPTNSPTPTPTGSVTPTPVSTGPDLVATNVFLTPSSPIQGSSSTISVTVKNQGNDVLPSSSIVKIAFFFDVAGTPTSTTPYSNSKTQTMSLAVNATAQVDFPKSFLTSGSHTVAVYIDPDNTIAETNDLNNATAPLTFTVVTPTATPTPTVTPTFTPTPTQSGPTPTPSSTNVALTGTGYRWSLNTTSTSNLNRFAASALNDNNTTVDVSLTTGGSSDIINGWEAAGVVWTTAQNNITSVEYTNGSWTSGGDGAFTANFGLQFSTDGTTWTNSGWSATPVYSYDSPASAGVKYTFTGAAFSNIKGARVVGQVHTGGSSWYAIAREVKVISTSTSSTPTSTPTPTQVVATATPTPTPTSTPGSSNIAINGAGYRWFGNTASASDGNKTAATGINDNNTTGDVALTTGGTDDSANAWEGAGVTWSTAQNNITSVEYTNGSWTSLDNGGFTANFKLQFSTDGTTWTDSGWTVTPAYSYDSPSVAGVAYTFTGNAASSIKGARVVGQVHTGTANSYYAIARELKVLATGTSTTPTPTPTGPTNIALSATGYRWWQNSSATVDANKVAEPKVNDNNTTVDFSLSTDSGSDIDNGWEAAGVVWTTSQNNISSVEYTNGAVTSVDDGAFTANFKLQFSTDGTTWTDSSWTVSPAYNYDSTTVSGVKYTFTGSAVSSIKGVRVVGQVKTGGNSWYAIGRELKVMASSSASSFSSQSLSTTPLDSSFLTTLFGPQKTSSLSVSAAASQAVNEYSFDILGRLTQAKYADASIWGYGFDKVDNRTTWNIYIPFTNPIVNGTAYFNYDNDNKLTSVGSYSYLYDLNGSLLTRKLGTTTDATLSYDFENRMTKHVNAQGITTTYKYDGNGTRLSRTANGTTQRYVVDVKGDLDKVLSQTNAFNSVTNSVVYGAGPISEGSTTSNTGRYYMLEDGLSNIRIYTDYQGKLRKYYDYDPYGNIRYESKDDGSLVAVISNNGAGSQNSITITGSFGGGAYDGIYKFATEERDNPSSYYYLRARYYDPLTGRFISRDPYVGSLSNPQTQNPYAYVGNNPIVRVDPSGKYYVELVTMLSGYYLLGLMIGGAVRGGVDYFGSSRCDKNLGTGLLAIGAGAQNAVESPTGQAALTIGVTGMYVAGNTPRYSSVPNTATNTLQKIEQNGGNALEGYVSKPFQNREGLLPSGGQYIEHDIYPFIRGVNRGAERLIIDKKTGAAWYTPDHYDSFMKIK